MNAYDLTQLYVIVTDVWPYSRGRIFVFVFYCHNSKNFEKHFCHMKKYRTKKKRFD